MTRHDVLVRLRHMLDHAREAGSLARNRQRSDLDTDRLLSLALTHLLEIVGEAGARIPADQRARWPAIPWADIIGLRNRLIHGYDAVDLDILWAIIQRDLTPLIVELDEIVSSYDCDTDSL
jgi:uncharacterized protein with HEPN domain